MLHRYQVPQVQRGLSGLVTKGKFHIQSVFLLQAPGRKHPHAHQNTSGCHSSPITAKVERLSTGVPSITLNVGGSCIVKGFRDPLVLWPPVLRGFHPWELWAVFKQWFALSRTRVRWPLLSSSSIRQIRAIRLRRSSGSGFERVMSESPHFRFSLRRQSAQRS